MAFNWPYRSIGELPSELPLFPLSRALLLPRTQLPLNIFEPRYLALFDAAMADKRLVGMVQPRDAEVVGTQDAPPLHAVGGLGRITQLAESGDGRYIVTLTGICRFRVGTETTAGTPYRTSRASYDDFAGDLVPAPDAEIVDRKGVIDALGAFAKAHGLKVDWEEIEGAPTETLVNALTMMSPFGVSEKQALLEAPDLRTRADTLIAVTQMELARVGQPSTRLQ